MKNQRAAAVFMVEPASFGFDEETAASNVFQHKLASPAAEVTAVAQREFHESTARLSEHDIEVLTFRDDPTPPKPDAVFPNNWFSTWPDGSVFLYPMATPSRRRERSERALDVLRQRFMVREVADLSASEDHGQFLEGTGAIVFDHANKIAYACLSPRCDKQLFTKHAKSLGYTPLVFRAFDQNGVAIYHTNVVLAVQSTTAVVCSAAITDSRKRHKILATLAQSGHEVIDISHEQLTRFCANVLEVQNRAGQAFLILSQTAYDAFTPRQRTQLSRDKTLLPLTIPTIETVGGGSARCMLAEIFLPPN